MSITVMVDPELIIRFSIMNYLFTRWDDCDAIVLSYKDLEVELQK